MIQSQDWIVMSARSYLISPSHGTKYHPCSRGSIPDCGVSDVSPENGGRLE